MLINMGKAKQEFECSYCTQPATHYIGCIVPRGKRNILSKEKTQNMVCEKHISDGIRNARSFARLSLLGNSLRPTR